MNKKQKKKLYKIISAAALTLIFKFLPFNGYIMFVLYLVPYLLVGFDSLKKAWKGIKKGQVFDENFLMAIATIGAFSVALISGSGDYVEAVAVMLFYQIGELFENYAVGKSRKNISALMDIRPDYANLCIDGEIKKVDPDEVTVGSIISVGPGEKIPLDGVVVEGVANLDTSALTGESKPRSISVDEEVTSGCICLDAVIKIKTTRPFGESTVSKILELVENASSRKSKSENFISKFAKIYTPTVCYAALALAILPPVMNLIRGIDANVMTWVYRALTFLVISCPCALVISIPLGFFAGIGGASRAGVLVKGSNYIESLSKIDTIVFDKTGTLTKGVFDVTEIHENEGAYSKDDLLELAAYTEGFSTHPIGKSVLAAYGKEIDKNKVSDVKEYAGEGVTARVDGKIIYAGNGKLMRRFDIAYKKCHIDGTIVYVAEDGEYAGHIVISDVPKETSKEAIDKLHKLGISNTVMLTGDATTIAKEVADELGIKEYYAKLMPQDKVAKVEELIGKQKEGKALAFVGDGINDAPVLTRADIGIAMGSMGSDAAIEAADVVLMDDNPLGIVKAIKIARKCMTIVYENIYLAIGVKLICLLLGAMGFAGMWLAIFADVGVMILAVLNAIRTLKVPRI